MYPAQSHLIPPRISLIQWDRPTVREGTGRKVGLLMHSARYVLFTPVNAGECRRIPSRIFRPGGTTKPVEDGLHGQSDDQLRNVVKMLKCSQNINPARHILDCYTLHTIHSLHSSLMVQSHYVAANALNIASQVADRDRLGPGRPAGALAPDSTHRRRLWARRGDKFGGLPHQPENRRLPLSPKQLPRTGTANLVPRGRRRAAVRLRALDVRRPRRHIRRLLRQEVAPATLRACGTLDVALATLRARRTLGAARKTLRARATTYSSRRRIPRWSWSP